MRQGTNAIEEYKASKGGDGLRIREDLPRIVRNDHDAMTAAEKDLLKWLGVFFRRPTPGEFMMRVRMPNGFSNSRQLRTLADLSRRLGNCMLDITTRQQIQLRGFTLATLLEIWEKLRTVDLHSLQTGMDNVRNLNGCPLAGVTADEAFDASPVVFELDRMLVGPDGNPEFTNLPRKFNVTITGCRKNCTHSESQDVALVPALRDGDSGFNVLVGGKMGSGGFTPASALDVFVSRADAARLVAEVVRIFRDHGPREARSKCRMAFLIQEWGLPRLRAELEQRMGTALPPVGDDLRTDERTDHLGIAGQQQHGLAAVGLCVPAGRLNPDQMEELGRLAEVYGAGEVRITTGQNAVIPFVAESALPALLAEPLLEEFSPAAAPFTRRLVACTGTDFCNLAQIDTKRHAVALARVLEQKLGSTHAPLSMHWSGCPAGCGNHQAADIGFRGMKTRIGDKLVDAVAIYVGGKTGAETRVGQQILDIVPCDAALPAIVANVIKNFDRFMNSQMVPLEALATDGTLAAAKPADVPKAEQTDTLAAAAGD